MHKDYIITFGVDDEAEQVGMGHHGGAWEFLAENLSLYEILLAAVDDDDDEPL